MNALFPLLKGRQTPLLKSKSVKATKNVIEFLFRKKINNQVSQRNKKIFQFFPVFSKWGNSNQKSFHHRFFYNFYSLEIIHFFRNLKVEVFLFVSLRSFFFFNCQLALFLSCCILDFITNCAMLLKFLKVQVIQFQDFGFFAQVFF